MPSPPLTIRPGRRMIRGVRRSAQLLIRAEVGRTAVPYLRRNVRRAWSLLADLVPAARALREVSLALVNDATMAGLHEQFLGIPGPTDVLTFELDRDRQNRVSAGEIIICVPHARRAAAAAGTDLRRELLLYALHGMLHLAGHDDRTRDGFRRMHAMEDDILSRLGIGPVFSPAPKAHARPARGRPRSRRGDHRA